MRNTEITRTWTFAEDEGGTTILEINDAHLTIARYTGPDCDGTTSEAHYEFVQRATDSEWPDGTFDNTLRRHSGQPVFVLCDNPQNGFDDYVDTELGSLLRSHYLVTQPDDHND